MEIILLERIEKLGAIGDVVSVKDGYARNFLLPRGLAAEANETNVALMKHELKVAEDRARKMKAEAETLAKTLAGVQVSVTAKVGENGRLFGSVGSADIARALHAKGYTAIDRRDIRLDAPIKALGDFRVPVRIHHDITVEIVVTVVAEPAA